MPTGETASNGVLGGMSFAVLKAEAHAAAHGDTVSEPQHEAASMLIRPLSSAIVEGIFICVSFSHHLRSFKQDMLASSGKLPQRKPAKCRSYASKEGKRRLPLS
jgi:hypothetical protein